MPIGANKTITIVPNYSYAFSPYDWGFFDSNDANQMSGVYINSIPKVGVLKWNGQVLTVPLTITGATWASSVVTISYSGSHIFSSGQKVVISGATPTAYNGTWIITGAGSNSISFNIYPNPGSISSGYLAIPWDDINNQFLVYESSILGNDTFTFQVINNANPYIMDSISRTMTIIASTFGVGTIGIGPEKWCMLEREIGEGVAPPMMAVPPNANVGIISNASWSSGYVTLTTTEQYVGSLFVGQSIVVMGMWPWAYNGSYTVSSLGINTVSYALNVNPGTFIASDSAGIVVSSLLTSNITTASWLNGIAIFATSSAYISNLQVGQTIAISGVTPDAYNGIYSVNNIGSTTFTAFPIRNPGSIGLVFNATWSNNIATITTSSDLVSTLSVGQQIVVSNVISTGGNYSYNGTWMITNLSVNTFSYNLNLNPGTYSSCGTISSIANSGKITYKYLGQITYASWSNNVVTFTSTASTINSLTIGETIVLYGTAVIMYPCVDGSPYGFNNTYVVTGIGTTTFTCALNTTPGKYWVGPGSLWTITNTNPGAYVSGGAITVNLAGQVLGASWSSNTATITVSSIYGATLSAGQTINISGVNPSGYNGQCVIQSVAASSFTFTCASNPGTYENGGQLYVVMPDYLWYLQAISKCQVTGSTAVVHYGNAGQFNDSRTASYFSQVALLRNFCHLSGLRYTVLVSGPGVSDDGNSANYSYGSYSPTSVGLDGTIVLFDGGDPCSWAEGIHVNQQVFEINSSGQIIPYNDALINLNWQNFGFIGTPWWCASTTGNSYWTWDVSHYGPLANYGFYSETGQPVLASQDTIVTRHASGLSSYPVNYYMPSSSSWQANTSYPASTILNIQYNGRQMIYVPVAAGISSTTQPNWASTPRSSSTNTYVLTENTGLQWAYCGDFSSEMARIYPIVPSKKYQFYDISFWVQTNNYVGNGIQCWLLWNGNYGPGTDVVGASTTPSSMGWTQLHLYWNTEYGGNAELLIETGITGVGAEVWFDDWQIQPVPLNHMLRRNETPISLTSLNGSIIYQEGVDFTGSSTICPTLTALTGTTITTDSITDAQGQLGKVVNDPLIKLNWYPGNGFVNGSISNAQTTFQVVGGQNQIESFDVPFVAIINSPTNPYSQSHSGVFTSTETILVTGVNCTSGQWTVVRGTPSYSYSVSNGYITIDSVLWDQYHDSPPPMTVVSSGALSSLPAETQLLFSWYHIVWQQWYYEVQRTFCMNAPGLLTKWQTEAAYCVQNWQADAYFLGIDEKAFVGWDTVCGYPNGTAGDAIAGNVNATISALQTASLAANTANPAIPTTPLMIAWQDMMDPYDNGSQQRFRRTSTDSCITGATGNPITDKMLIFANWNHGGVVIDGQYGFGDTIGVPVNRSQQFFAVNGFRQVMAGFAGGSTVPILSIAWLAGIVTVGVPSWFMGYFGVGSLLGVTGVIPVAYNGLWIVIALNSSNSTFMFTLNNNPGNAVTLGYVGMSDQISGWLEMAEPYNCIGGMFTYWDQNPNLGPLTQWDLTGTPGLDFNGWVQAVNSTIFSSATIMSTQTMSASVQPFAIKPQTRIEIPIL